MPALGAGISLRWAQSLCNEMAGTSPAMTKENPRPASGEKENVRAKAA
jgi:hypothetical protein